MRRSEQLINVTNVDEQDHHDDYNVDAGDCAEDFDVSDEPAISSSVSLRANVCKNRAKSKFRGHSQKIIFAHILSIDGYK